MTSHYLTAFRSIRPAHILNQEDALQSLVYLRMNLKAKPAEWTREYVEARIKRFGLANSQIDTRGSEVSDYSTHEESFFRNGEIPKLDERMAFFKSRTIDVMNEFYLNEKELPAHLVHVSCTGYIAPNAAQDIAAEWKKNRGHHTTITNAYHMGCYASLPAIRMARGLMLAEKKEVRADIVHQELCSVHFDPSTLDPEQIVVQSLFADGHIRYSLTQELHGSGLKVRALREEILPESSESMSWVPSSTHFAMKLGREVPVKIKHALKPFLKELLAEAEVPAGAAIIFAVHPGGPKIIEAVEKELELTEAQTKESHEVLREFGNMSSATLPHIWQKILANPERSNGTFVVSMAFGPGLTLSGGVFEICRT